jgi:DNA-binding NtrC family response regulator
MSPLAPAVHTLVVDDKASHRNALLLTLERLGHETREAATVEAAIALLREMHFDLVITDMELPHAPGEPARMECGLEVIRAAREVDPDSVVLAITGYATVDNAVQAMQEGAVDYIHKGSSLADLRARLEQALATRKLRREQRGED